MIEDPDYVILLGVAGPMVPGGLRQVIIDMVKREFIHGIVTSAANVIHDVIEVLGFRHYRGSFKVDDGTLGRKGIGRIGDIFISENAFRVLGSFMLKFFKRISSQGKVSVSNLLHLLGEDLVRYGESILGEASKREIPIFCPGFLDSILSYQLIASEVEIDLVLDFNKLVNLQCDAKKVGAIILGGGLPKHHILLTSLLRGGVDAAIQVTMDRFETGSLSGAKLREALSWGKVRDPKKLVTIIADATAIFPVILAAALDIWNESRPRNA
jgi:deoxyhypusine synthase